MTVSVEIEERISKCRKILATDPNSQIFAALAEAYRRKGELDMAFKVCQTGLRIHPTYGSAHIVMAKINLDRGLYDWAEAEVGKARDATGPSRSVDLLLAEISIYKGEYKKAVKLLNKLSEVEPENTQIRRLLDLAKKIPAEQARLTGQPVPEPTVIENKSAGAGTTVDPEPSAPLGPADVLIGALKVEHTQGALFIDSDGLVIESRWDSKLDATICGASLAEVNKFLNRELMKTSFGQVGNVLIETAELIFYLQWAKDGMYLIVGEPAVNLGSLRMRMASLIPQEQVH